jgi:ADP-heptose:LPS heptosyltransferase
MYAMGMSGTLILFPGALGDFVCFLPALAGLSRADPGGLTLVAKPELLSLLADTGATLVSIDRREIANLYGGEGAVDTNTRELLGSGERAYSWTGAGVSEFVARLSRITAGPAHVFPFRGMRPGEHAVDYYLRCAGVAAQPFVGMLSIDVAWLADFERRNDFDHRPILALHPGSGSPTKNWTGFHDLAQAWVQRHGDRWWIVVLHGPAEAESKAPEIPGTLTLRQLSLPQAAALLRRCTAYAGNDSGISHLAGAVGAAGVVLFGPSDPGTWAPRADRLRVLHAPEPCSSCGPAIFCRHRLAVERVELELRRFEGKIQP